MAKKRMPSPTEDDINRIAETIDNLDQKNEIIDPDSFDAEFNDYFDENPEIRDNNSVRVKVFERLRKMHPDRIGKEKIFTKAGGKDLKRDRQSDAKVITSDRKRYRQLGASRSDLEGYDTKRKELNIVGVVKGKTVFTEQTTVKIGGKTVIRHRDRLGRFASVKAS